MSNDTRQFLHGVRAALPVIASITPFSLLFGALAAEQSLSLAEVVLMSVLLYAGASQMVGIELFGADIAPWIVVFSILAVNFRHVLYSAAMGKTIRHFALAPKALAFFVMTDPQFAVTEKHAEGGAPVTPAWYFGLGVPCYAMWIAGSVLGAVFGNLIGDPRATGVDFLLPLYFLGLVMGFRGRAMWLPVVGVSGAVSVGAHQIVGTPWHISVGALAGVIVAVALAGRHVGERPA
ncbi:MULTISPECIES: AzlC family ABC transporter permease [unclassified Roseitalea]|uniref:AzlC family ABC transporter permease n=1 Tax=unclassified Roseitalea TaxID=2639107 RepID=UPI00273F1795|nr:MULTISPECIES: AzlC family ABC transporter permease [unclassified Roseitalea]